MQSFSRMAIWESVNLGKGCIGYRCFSLWIFSFSLLLVTQVDSTEGLDCPMSPVIVNNSDIVTWSVPVVNSSSPVHLASTHQPGGYFPLLETTNVTYTATITATNGMTTTETCSFIVRIIPDGSPVVTSCPANKAYDTLPANFWTDINNIPTAEGCGQSGGDCMTTSSPRAGSDFRLGTTRVTYRFTNTTRGLTSRCSFRVTIAGVSNNIVGPSVTNCPLDYMVVVPRGTLSTEVSWAEPVFTDAVGNDLSSFRTKPPGSEFRRGSTEVLYVAMDSNFKRALCTFNVTVIVDDLPPEVQCPENITQYERENVAGLEVDWPPPNATDNTGSIRMTVRPESGTFFQASIGGQMDEVVVNVYDAYGNSANCSFFVNIITDTRPQIECEDIMPDTLPGEAHAVVTWPNVNITDDYTPLSMLMVNSTRQSGLRVRYNDPVVVTITARDERGNEGTCTFDIDVKDNEKPEWNNCPEFDITRAATPGSNQATVEWDKPTATDNSGEELIIRGPHYSLLFTAGTHLIVYTATDSSRNSVNCEFNVTVTVDSTVPVFTVPCVDMSFNTKPEGSNSAVVTWDDRTATDDDSVPTITGNYASDQRLTIGSYDIEYRAVDESGNVAYCRFTVTVVDGENPRFTFCPEEDVSVNILAMEDTVLVRWAVPIATDNSGSVEVTPMAGSIPFGSKFTNGTYMIPYTAEDPAGNTATSCEVTVKVAVKSDTILIRARIVLDAVGGIDGSFDDSSVPLDNLASDLDDYFRYLNPLTEYFVGITIAPNSLRFNSPENDAEIDFALYLCDPSHTNEAEIEEAFTSTLSLTNSFPMDNRVVEGSLDLLVKEFRGEFTLVRINNINNVDFGQCCANPLSEEYKELEDRVNTQLDFMFTDMIGFLMVSVVRFDPGSVVVTFSVTFDLISPATEADIMTEFENDVVDLQLRLGSELFLADSTPLINVTEVCPDPDTTPCLNEGSCTVNVTTYDDTCTCPSGYIGRYCGDVVLPSATITTGAIIGIVVGVVGFFLILTFICCCYFICATRIQTKRWAGHAGDEWAVREYDWERQHGALLPMVTMEDPYTRRSQVYGDRGYDNRAGPVITEIENEGPVFHHDDATERNALPYLSPAAHSPSPPPPFVEPFRPPIPIPHETVPAPRFGHEYWDANCYLRPSSTTQPGPVYRPPPRGSDRAQRAYFQNIRDGFFRSRHRRSENVGPRFHGDDRPEEVGEMKRRLFHEFNY